MTSRKQLKARIRARMARTGESYTTAHRHVAGPPIPTEVDGYPLRGGAHPSSAGLSAVLARHGVRAGGAELSEAMLFGISGGPGAGYILWEFAHDDSRLIVLAFGSQWQYAERAPLAGLERLGIPVRVGRTGGTVTAARSLAAELDAGNPALVWPDRYVAGYWQLPPMLDGMGGDPVVVYARDGDSYRIDDRGPGLLTVPVDRFDAARARVGSYKNLMIVPAPDGDVPAEVLHRAVRDGIADCAQRLSVGSTSFALPAWRKWSRMITDRKAAKGWPQVFADGRGLARALASVWEGASPVGMSGGHLRDLTADFLDEAEPLVGGTAAAAQAWRDAAAAWQRVADTALPVDVPEFARLRELTAAVQQAVGDGDAGAEDARQAAEQLWALRTELDAAPPLTGADRDQLFADLGARVAEVYEAERAATAELAALTPAPTS